MHKKYLMGFIFSFLVFSQAFAQLYVNRQNVNLMQDVVYIEFIVSGNFFMRGSSTFAIIDYGQLQTAGRRRQNRITDKEGNEKLFQSEIEVFNFLYQNGWIHETTYSRESSVYHIFRRRGINKD